MGAVYLARMSEVGAPAELRPALRAFAAAQGAFHERNQAANEAKASYRTALRAPHQAVAALGKAIEALAGALSGAFVDTRRAPFAAFGAEGPAALLKHAVATLPARVNTLLDAVAAARPPERVRDALTACRRAVGGLEASLAGLSAPAVTDRCARGARDEALRAWRRALASLKLHAALAWQDEPATFKAIFAGVQALQMPVVHRRRRARAPSLPGTPATPPTAAEGTPRLGPRSAA